MITNLEEVKRITKTIAYTKVQENEVLPFLAIHPFISDMYWYEKVFKENHLIYKNILSRILKYLMNGIVFFLKELMQLKMLTMFICIGKKHTNSHL